MLIKIQCACGAKYAFEAAPELAEAPVPFVCPACGADCSALASQRVREQFRQPVAGPVQAARRLPRPAASERRHTGQLSRRRWTRWAALALGGLALAAGSLWLWDTLAGAQPRLLATFPLPPDEAEPFCAFTGPAHVVFRSGRQLKGYDLRARRETWSVALLDETSLVQAAARLAAQRQGKLAPARAASDREDAEAEEPLGPDTTASSATRAPAPTGPTPRELAEAALLRSLRFHALDRQVWAVLPSRAACFEGLTGRILSEVPLPGPVVGFQTSGHALLLAVQRSARAGTLLRIELPGGEVRTADVPAEAIVPPLPRPSPGAKPVSPPGQPTTPLGKALASAQRIRALNEARNQAIAEAADEGARSPQPAWVDGSRTEYILAGPNVVRLAVRLVERRLSSEGRAQHGLEDQSRYRVSLQRLLGEAGTEWSGEVIGPPQLFPASTVDVLVSGQRVQVFDKANQAHWAGNLTSPLGPEFRWPSWAAERGGEAERSPCLEHGSSLYVFDQSALTAFDLDRGTVRWQWPSAGIRRLRCDLQGMLYVVTHATPPEVSAGHPSTRPMRGASPSLVKLDGRTGRVLWRAEGLGDACYLTDRFVFAAETGRSTGHYARVWRLEPSTGRPIWEYTAPWPAHTLVFHQNTFLAASSQSWQAIAFRAR